MDVIVVTFFHKKKQVQGMKFIQPLHLSVFKTLKDS